MASVGAWLPRVRLLFSAAAVLWLSCPAHAGSDAWTTGGPYGAVVRALAVHPSAPGTLYAGAYGGIFKSVDSGGSWAFVNVGLPNLASLWVNALAIDPTTPSTLYVGTSEYRDGHGVFKSVDSGATWAAADTGLTGMSVSSLAIDPIAPATLYAGTFGGIFKSVDSGRSWLPVNVGLPSPGHLQVNALAIDPIASATLYAGTELGISRSVDFGATWVSLNVPGLDVNIQTLAIDPKNPSTLYAGAVTGSLYRSLNSGGTWALASTGLPPEPVSALVIDPTTPSTLYAGTYGQVFRSVNSGDTWNGVGTRPPYVDPSTLAAVSALAIDPTASTTVYAADGTGVLKSTDSGVSWAPAMTGLANLSITSLVVDPGTPATVYAGTENGPLFKSVNSGSTWTVANTGLSNTTVLTLAIDPKTPTTLYAGQLLNGIYRSTNSGATWIRTGQPNTGQPFVTVKALAIDPASPTTIYVSLDARPSEAGAVFKSTDSGGTWALASAGLTSQIVFALAIDAKTPATLYAGTLDGIFRSTDRAASWTSLGLPGLSVGTLAIDARTTPSILYASAAYVATGVAAGVFRSMDSGATWTAANLGLTDLSVQALVVDPNASSIYAGGPAGGVFKSADFGASWTAVNRGLKNLGVRALALDPSGATTVYAGLFPGSVWQATPPTLGESDLALTVSDSPDPVTGTTPFTYTIAVTNNGPDAASALFVTQTLAAGVVFDRAIGGGWTCGASASLLTCTRPGAGLGPLPSISVQVTPGPAASVLTSLASVSAAELDPDAADNSATETTTVREALVWLATRTKTAFADAGRFLRSTDLTYTITLTNGGSQAQPDSPGPEFEDVLPASLNLISASSSSGIVASDLAANRVNWNGSIPSGGAVTLTVHASIKPTVSLGTTIGNQGTLHYDADGNGTNEATTATDDPAAPGANDPTTFVVVSPPMRLFTLPPCRLVDTRNAPGTLDGPALLSNAQRIFPLVGHCGIPPTAQAVSVNLTVSEPTEAGHLRLYPADASLPNASSINYTAGQTRANNAVLFLSDRGELALFCVQWTGTAHFILDVNGYFE